jgi:hypothetical protein
MLIATDADIEARIGPLSAEQAAKLPALLADATAELQAYCGHSIVRVDDDQILLHGSHGRLLLPGRPVVSVTSVELFDRGEWLAVAGWSWDGLSGIDLRGAHLAQAPKADTQTYRVTYSHGWALGSIPPLLVTKACAMVARVLTAPSPIDGVVSESIGQYSYQLQQGMGGAGTAVRLSANDERVLARAGFRRSLHSIAVRAQ